MLYDLKKNGEVRSQDEGIGDDGFVLGGFSDPLTHFGSRDYA
jgi:hypothetical protein